MKIHRTIAPMLLMAVVGCSVNDPCLYPAPGTEDVNVDTHLVIEFAETITHAVPWPQTGRPFLALHQELRNLHRRTIS